MFGKILSYVWLIVSQAFYLLVVLYVFERLHDRLETIMVGVLGLIYVTVRSLAVAQWIDQTTRFTALAKQIELIKKAVILGYESDTNEWEVAENSIMHRYFKLTIVGVFLTLISLVCLWRIFSVL